MGKDIYGVTSKILYREIALLGSPQGRADLANLRNSMGKNLSQCPEIWPIIFENLPEEFLSRKKDLSDEERAIINSLQLFALHQQGQEKPVNIGKDEGYSNMGTSLRDLRQGDGRLGADRRFNAMLTSSTYEEFIGHLRHLVKILKAKSPQSKVNYGNLASDLYWILRGKKDDVIISWAREYYRENRKDKGEEDNDK